MTEKTDIELLARLKKIKEEMQRLEMEYAEVSKEIERRVSEFENTKTND